MTSWTLDAVLCCCWCVGAHAQACLLVLGTQLCLAGCCQGPVLCDVSVVPCFTLVVHGFCRLGGWEEQCVLCYVSKWVVSNLAATHASFTSHQECRGTFPDEHNSTVITHPAAIDGRDS